MIAMGLLMKHFQLYVKRVQLALVVVTELELFNAVKMVKVVDVLLKQETPMMNDAMGLIMTVMEALMKTFQHLVRFVRRVKECVDKTPLLGVQRMD